MIPDLPILPVNQRYALREAAEVHGFLQTHPSLIPLLVEAHGKVAEYFRPSPGVILEIVTDPEVAGLEKMFGYIVTPLAPEEAGKRLQQFDREWFLLQIPRAKGLLNFDVEFV